MGTKNRLSICSILFTGLIGSSTFADSPIEFTENQFDLIPRVWQCGLVDEQTPRSYRENATPLGCSLRGFSKFLFGSEPEVEVIIDEIQPQCIKHDMCYRHGSYTYGYSRTDCDDQLVDGISSVCEQKEEGSSESKACQRVGRVMKLGVTVAGGRFFRSPERDRNNKKKNKSLDRKGLYCEYDGPGYLHDLWQELVPGTVHRDAIEYHWAYANDKERHYLNQYLKESIEFLENL